VGAIGEARAFEPLIVALRDRSDGVREAATEALGAFGDARAVEPLIVALRDRSDEVREAARKAFARMFRAGVAEPASPIAASLIAALRDEDESVVQIARFGIEEAGVRTLAEALRDIDDLDQRTHVDALGVLWETQKGRLSAWQTRTKKRARSESDLEWLQLWSEPGDVGGPSQGPDKAELAARAASEADFEADLDWLRQERLRVRFPPARSDPG
jgi:HEAT repeat protein